MRAEPDLYLITAVRAEAARRGDRHHDSGVRHGERGQFAGDMLSEPGRGLGTRTRQLASEVGHFGGEIFFLLRQRADLVLITVKFRQSRPCSLRPRQNRCQVTAWLVTEPGSIGTYKPRELGPALLHGREPGRICL